VNLAHAIEHPRPFASLHKSADSVVTDACIWLSRCRIVGLELHSIPPGTLCSNERNVQIPYFDKIVRQRRWLKSTTPMLELESDVETPQSTSAVSPVPHVVLVPEAVCLLCSFDHCQNLHNERIMFDGWDLQFSGSCLYLTISLLLLRISLLISSPFSCIFPH